MVSAKIATALALIVILAAWLWLGTSLWLAPQRQEPALGLVLPLDLAARRDDAAQSAGALSR